MKRPDPIWETEYSRSRRKHAHRCVGCDRVITPGERVMMCRTGRGTRAMHIECTEMTVVDGHTYRDSMIAWGLEGLKKVGWRVPELDTRYK